jgi:putative MATE family efflux protein
MPSGTDSMEPSNAAGPAGSKGPGLHRSVLSLSWPASVEYLIITGIVFADILFLARLGTDVIAGVGVAVTLFRVFYEVFNSVAIASTTVVAQAVGARNLDLAKRGAAQSVLLAACLGIISGGVGVVVASGAMALMGTSGLVMESGATYMRINLLASPFYAITLAGGGVLKGAGDTRTPMVYTLVSSGLKIVLTAGLVFGMWGLPAMGVAGAGLATLFGYALAAALVLTKLWKGFDGIRLNARAFIPDRPLLLRIGKLAWPVAGERMFMRLGFVFYMRVVSALGTVALAANQIALRLESISLTVGFGFTVAATTLVGQAIGRRDEDGAVQRAWTTARFSLVTMASLTVLLILIRYWAVGIFRPEAGVRDLAVACLIIGACEMPAFGVLFTFAGALRGAGDTHTPMLVAIVGTFLFRLPLVYLLGIGLGLGLKGIWYGTLLDWIGRAVIMYFVFRRGHWKRKAFIQHGEYVNT